MCPLLHRVAFGEPNECLYHRMFAGCLFGIFIGIVFYEWIVSGIKFHYTTIYTLGIIFIFLLTMGCTLSSQIRCITLLTMPSFFSKSGRHIIQALIISAVMSKPVPNIIDNVQEIMRMYTCSNAMAHNLSQARYDLLVKPFKAAFLNTKLDSEELKDMLGSVNNVVEPFAQEIEGVDDVKFIQEENDYMDTMLNDTQRSAEIETKYSDILKFKKNRNASTEIENNLANETESANYTAQAEEYQEQYYKKLETRCENVKTQMGKACKNRFSSFKEKCEAAIHWAISWAICWPMKLDVVCDIVKMFTYGGYDCDPSSSVSSFVGKGYVDLKTAPERLKSKVIEERIQYKLIKPPNFVELHSVVSITKEFVHEIYVKKSLADAFLTIIRTILAFLFILVILSAQTYHQKYLNFTDFDNIYITADYRVLDARRRKYKKPTILPQTKHEKKRTADPYSLCLSNVEMSAWNSEFWLIVALVLICSAVVAMDFALSRAMDWMRENLEFSYSEKGNHEFNIEVEGIGFVAILVRSIIQNFNFKKEMIGDVSNRGCLPISKHLTKSDYIRLYGTCVFLCLCTYAEGYLKRLRRAICAFYYREQEKKRIEILYRKNLTFRQQMLQGKIEEMIRKAQKNELVFNERLLYRFYQLFPYPWGLPLKILSGARPCCIICEECEAFYFFWNPKHVQCMKCSSYYCVECWMNFSKSCFYCYAAERLNMDKKLRASVTYS